MLLIIVLCTCASPSDETEDSKGFSPEISATLTAVADVASLSNNLQYIPQPQTVAIEITPTVPDDIQEQIVWYRGGAGGGDDPCFSNGFYISLWDSSIEVIQNMDVQFFVCYESPDPIEISILMPDGTNVEVESRPEQEGRIRSSFQLDFGLALGQYVILARQDDTVAMNIFELRMPVEPTLTTSGDITWLTGFQPNEVIRLIFYEENLIPPDRGLIMSVTGVALIEADENGTARIEATSVWAIGETTGIVFDYIGHIPGDPFELCADTMLSRLQIGEDAAVGNPDSTQRVRVYFWLQELINQYSSPDYIANGEVVTVIGGPVCADSNRWWFVEVLSDGNFFWISEANQESYFLEPIR